MVSKSKSIGTILEDYEKVWQRDRFKINKPKKRRSKNSPKYTFISVKVLANLRARTRASLKGKDRAHLRTVAIPKYKAQVKKHHLINTVLRIKAQEKLKIAQALLSKQDVANRKMLEARLKIHHQKYLDMKKRKK